MIASARGFRHNAAVPAPAAAPLPTGPLLPDRITLYPPTHWSLVLAAAGPDAAAADQALGELCAAYREPLCRVARGLRHGFGDDEDLVQAFLAWVLETRPLRRFERREARFRAFLTTCLKHFLADDRRAAARRPQLVSGDASGEAIAPAAMDLRSLVDRELARELDARALRALESAAVLEGRAAEWALLRPALRGDLPHGALPGIAVQLGLSHAAVRHRVRAWREGYLDAFRHEIRALCAAELEADELRYLLALTVQEAGAP